MANTPNFNKIPNKRINFNQKEFYEDNFDKVKVFAEEVGISLNDKQAQIDVLVVNGDSSPAADQARVDANGVLKASLKTRLDDDYLEVNAQLAGKATQADLNATNNVVALKANTSDVNDNFTDVNAQLADISSQTYVTEKEKTIDVNVKLSLKTDKIYSDTKLELKRDKAIKINGTNDFDNETKGQMTGVTPITYSPIQLDGSITPIKTHI